MHLRYQAAILMLLFAAMAQVADCAPIVFEHWGVATGWIGSTPFSNQEFKVTATGETSNRIYIPGSAPPPVPDPSVYSIEHDSASITISGVGEFTLTSMTRTFYSNVVGAVGWGREGTQGDIFDGPFSIPALQSWDMMTSLPEVVGTGVVIDSLGLPAIMTTGGQLQLSGEYGVAAKFRATVIPEPNGFYLVTILGIAAMAALNSSKRGIRGINREGRNVV